MFLFFNFFTANFCRVDRQHFVQTALADLRDTTKKIDGATVKIEKGFGDLVQEIRMVAQRVPSLLPVVATADSFSLDLGKQLETIRQANNAVTSLTSNIVDAANAATGVHLVTQPMPMRIVGTDVKGRYFEKDVYVGLTGGSDDPNAAGAEKKSGEQKPFSATKGSAD